MKIIDKSRENITTEEILGIVKNSASIRDYFDNTFRTIVDWIVLDMEDGKSRPAIYIRTDGPTVYTTSGVVIRRVQEYTDKARKKNISLPLARFYKGVSKSNGREFFGVYFETQL